MRVLRSTQRRRTGRRTGSFLSAIPAVTRNHPLLNSRFMLPKTPPPLDVADGAAAAISAPITAASSMHCFIAADACFWLLRVAEVSSPMCEYAGVVSPRR